MACVQGSLACSRVGVAKASRNWGTNLKEKRFHGPSYSGVWRESDDKETRVPLKFLYSPGLILSLRNKSNKSSKRSRQTVQEEQEEEEENEEESNWEDEFENDPNVVKDYKDLEKVVQSLRYDVIMKAGLDIARNKVEDAFYNNELRLNGEKLWKKSRTVKIGDTLDLIVGEDKETGTAVVMRVVLKKVSNKTESEKYKVILRRWKNLKVPKQDVLK
ncbi:mitochondrial transcription rescue factor 1 [Grus japonensis]|uniref:Mitochondrial transcription rescue factor 1 n=1 Tax=Grus japonensis TaxID=30415 RepID=A0ABC9WME8_GRUJA